MTDVSKLLNEKVIEFNSKIKDEPGTAKMIEGKTRTICICESFLDFISEPVLIYVGSGQDQ